jgi:type II secretory pathway pseudopilin PulG
MAALGSPLSARSSQRRHPERVGRTRIGASLPCHATQSRAAATAAWRARALREDSGFTLVELLVASAMSIVVLAAVLGLLISSQNIQASNDEWAEVIQEARTGLAAMTHDIRQAYNILGTSNNSIEFYATVGGKNYEIQYKCDEPQKEGTSYYECVRKEAAFEGTKPPSSLPAKGVPMIKDVLNGTSAEKEPVFTKYEPNEIAPDLVTIRLAVPAAGTLKLAGAKPLQHHVILSDAAYIRNMALGA